RSQRGSCNLESIFRARMGRTALARACVILRAEVLRAASNLFLCLLLATTLIWGGCISCEQYFMLGAAKDCCNPHGHCKKKSTGNTSISRDCSQIAFEHQNGIDSHIAPAVSVGLIELPLPTVSPLQRVHWTVPMDSSPPDLQLLHSTFRI